MAETVAGAEPEIAAKNALASVVIKASPPAIVPTRLSAKSTKRREMPPEPIRFPANIKKGMASKGNDSNAVIAF